MYGLVNKAVQDLVTQAHGTETWEAIAEHAGVDGIGFVSMDSYDDSLTYRLVMSAAEILQVEASELLEAFGTHWITYTAREGYGELLDMSGDSFEDFLQNLDGLHSRVGLILPNMRPPSFSSEAIGDGVFRLHYHSERDGLSPMVIGLIRGLADKFDLDATIRREPSESDADGVVFVIETRARVAG